MKKFLFLGACVASLAVASSSAFAAVSYGQDGTLTVTAPADGSTDPVTSITVDASSFGTDGQKTLLMTKDGDETGFIYYIDQAQSGTGIFEGLVLNLPEGKEALDAGTYTIKVGNDKAAALQTATLTIADDQTPAVGKDFTFGDVDGKDGAAIADANYILAYVAKGTPERGGAFAIGTKVKVGDKEFIFGDVDGKDGAAIADANYILAYVAKGTPERGGAFAIGAEVTGAVEVTE